MEAEVRVATLIPPEQIVQPLWQGNWGQPSESTSRPKTQDFP
jgi:hypothetical protein